MKVLLLTAKEIPVERWDAFISKSPQATVFALYAYISLVCDDWKAIVVEDGEQWVGVMPISVKRKYGLKYAMQPLWTQHWGVFFRPKTATQTYAQYSFQRKVSIHIIENLPNVGLFAYRFSPRFSYPLPFHWAGYALTTRYTYQLDMTVGNERLWKGLSSSTKRHIKKAKRAGLLVEKGEPNELFELLQLNQTRGRDLFGGGKGMDLIFPKIVNYLCASGLGEVLVVRKQGEKAIYAAGIYVRFASSCVYLMGAQDSDMKQLGGMSLLMWEAMIQSLDTCTLFDFEGSMIEGIERFFRGFGAKPVPYLEIRNNKLPIIIRWIQELRS